MLDMFENAGWLKTAGSVGAILIPLQDDGLGDMGVASPTQKKSQSQGEVIMRKPFSFLLAAISLIVCASASFGTDDTEVTGGVRVRLYPGASCKPILGVNTPNVFSQPS